MEIGRLIAKTVRQGKIKKPQVIAFKSSKI